MARGHEVRILLLVLLQFRVHAFSSLSSGRRPWTSWLSLLADAGAPAVLTPVT